MTKLLKFFCFQFPSLKTLEGVNLDYITVTKVLKNVSGQKYVGNEEKCEIVKFVVLAEY